MTAPPVTLQNLGTAMLATLLPAPEETAVVTTPCVDAAW